MNWGFSKSQVFLVAAFLFLMVLLGWRILSARPAASFPEPAKDYEPEEDIIPNLLVENLRVTFSRGGDKERILYFKRARQCTGPDGPIYEVEKPEVTMAKIGDMKFTLEADEGSFDPRSGDWRLAGHVHAASDSVREFFADRAQYFASQDLIRAWGEEHPLRLIDQGMEIEAKELQTDSEFNTFKFSDAEGEMEGDFLPAEKEHVDE